MCFLGAAYHSPTHPHSFPCSLLTAPPHYNFYSPFLKSGGTHLGDFLKYPMIGVMPLCPGAQCPWPFIPPSPGCPALVTSVVCLSLRSPHLHLPSPALVPTGSWWNGWVGGLPSRQCSAAASATWGTADCLSLRSTLTLRSFAPSFALLGKCTLSTPNSVPPTSLSTHLSPLRSLLTISASFLSSSFTPPAPTLRCYPLQTREEGSGANVGQASCRSSGT